MSSQERIKQIRQRSEGSFTTGVPIGTDGILVDMISELDLEEELRLGGNHYVDIVETNTATEIKEWYFSEARGSRTIEQMSQDDLITFSASVSIISAVQYNIVTDSNDDENTDIIMADDDYLVSRENIASDEERIEMSLYRGDLDNEGILIHHKTIYIYENSDGEIAIDEQVDYSGNVNNLF